jgi:hypothetical protein
MSTLGELTTRIHGDLNATSITDVVVQQIKLAIRHYHSVPLWFTEATTSLSVSQAYVAVPADFVYEMGFYVMQSGIPVPMDKRLPNEIFDNRATTGARPTEYTYYGDRFEFNYSADSVYTMRLDYIKELTTLSAAADTNAWLTHGEDLIASRAKKVLFSEYLKDERAAARAAVLEKEAYSSLLRHRDQRHGTGYTRAYYP